MGWDFGGEDRRVTLVRKMIEKVRSGGRGRNGLFPNSLRIISSCLKTVSSNAGSVASSVRSAGASVAASISVPADDEIRDQVSQSKFQHSGYLIFGFWILDFGLGFLVK